MLGGNPVERVRYEVVREEQTLDADTTLTNEKLITECETLNEADTAIERLLSQKIPPNVTRRVLAYKIVTTCIFDEVA